MRDDVVNGLVSREAAERDYGVVLTADGAVDEQATHPAPPLSIEAFNKVRSQPKPAARLKLSANTRYLPGKFT